jgi:hypothetical protein
MGSNSRCVSKRAGVLGWIPRYTADDFYVSIAPEGDVVLTSGQVSVGNKL